VLNKEFSHIAECGERSPSLMIPYIIGGSQSYLGQWPWTVGIRIGHYFVCGVALISGTWVVTAGHCLQK
jgi:secreted trypsin-like serine protease